MFTFWNHFVDFLRPVSSFLVFRNLLLHSTSQSLYIYINKQKEVKLHINLFHIQIIIFAIVFALF